MLRQKLNPHTGSKEYCLISREGEKVLEWFGKKKPSEERVEHAEGRVQYWKHHKK